VTTTTTSPKQNVEPSIGLPAGWMLAIAIGVPALLGAVWWVTCTVGPWSSEVATAGVAGAAVTAVAAVAGTLIIAPWKVQPIGLWMTLWLAGVVVRLLIAPVLTFLLYSATSLRLVPLGCAVGLTYLATLLVEAAMLSRYLNRMLPSP